MSKREVIMALAEYFNLDVPENWDDLCHSYAWTSGCSVRGSDNWLTLENVINALDDAWLLDEDFD